MSAVKRKAVESSQRAPRSGGGPGHKRRRHETEERQRQGQGQGVASLRQREGQQQAALPPPKQKKKINKPKHLSRKLEQAQKQLEAQEDGAESVLTALEEQKAKLDERKVEAKEKFYTLCKSLVGEEKWNEEKQAIYEKLINEKGCNKKKFLAALGVEEAKEKIKNRPVRDGSKRKQVSREKKRQKKRNFQPKTDRETTKTQIAS